MGIGKKVMAPKAKDYNRSSVSGKNHETTIDSMQIDTQQSSPTSLPSPSSQPSMPLPSPSPEPTPAASPPPITPNLDNDTIMVKQPLEIGTKAPCKWRAEFHECEIIDRRLKPGTDIYEYYVHYSSFNRRLDEWVEFDRFDLKALVAFEAKRLARKAASERANQVSRSKQEKKKKDSKKRKSSTKDPDRSKQTSDRVKQQKQEKKQEEATKVKNIQTIVIGAWAIDTWYYSPFPPEYSGYSTLYFCEFCLKFVRSRDSLQRHCDRCILRHPPGIEIYRKDNISVFEVDGATNRIYCQNLCYIAKLFLDHKTLYYDVDPFWFYIMCEIDERGAHIVGYFSKEKYSEEDYNVACILTLPPFQRKGYGKFLISFSYELSKLENLVGSPEKPLSDLGLLGYRSYWSHVLVDLLRSEDSSALSVYAISEKTMMKTEDIVGTLQALHLIQYYEGQHIIDMRRVNNMKMGSRGLPCDSSCIKWTPHSYGPGVQIPTGSTLVGPSTGRRR